VKEAASEPPNLTLVAPLKLVPVMVTSEPAAPEPGVKLLIVGAASKVKEDGLRDVPLGVVTEILPVEPLLTTAEISVLEFTVKEAASVPPNLTLVAPMKLVPVIVTLEPAAPEEGVNEVMTGGALWVNTLELIAVPPRVVILILPVDPLPTTAVIFVLEFTLYEAAEISPNFTETALLKFLPVIETEVPARPEAGVNEVITGAGTKV
jgi:hypothetical protein